MHETKVKKELERGLELSVISLVDSLIECAHGLRASDIHIEPNEKAVRIRLRVDGALNDYFTFPKEIQPEIIGRIKVLASLRTDEHQAAQDGRFRHLVAAAPIDIRVSIVPSHYGENAVLRLLSDKSEEFTLEMLGLNASDEQKILQAIKRPYGMILATGPTGSGKTTSLYTILKILNTKDVSIVTIEDPIEYAIGNIVQIQVNSRTGLTFANGLRSILRQDPNIIMVGEIRDSETAAIAVNTSLTGHLLLSTLHTNDASTTLPRLLDMKIEPYLVASTVNVVIGQRLVRKICLNCKEERVISESERKSLAGILPAKFFGNGNGSAVFYHGAGCSKCRKSGYRGRVGIFEVLEVDGKIREAFLRKASAREIKDIAVANGMTTMVEDGLQKAKAGLTTIEEVLRVINE